MVITPEGEYYITPSHPTLVDLPKHTAILPDFSEAITSMTELPKFEQNLGELQRYDYLRLEKKFDELADKIVHSLEQNQSQLNVNLDPDGLWSVYEKRKGRTKYINERLNFRRN